jgi:hypothetical protein
VNLCDLKDSRKGSSAIILGAGPSMAKFDEHSLDGHVVFTVNSSILIDPSMCHFWVGDDQDTRHWSYFNKQVRNSPCVKLVDAARLGRHVDHFDQDKVVRYVRQPWLDWYDPKTKQYHPEKLSLTKDCLLPLAGTRTSVATAAHLAWIMGCDPIILAGCDCRYQGTKRWFWQCDEWPGERPSRIGADPFPNRLQKVGDAVMDTHNIEMLAFWRAFYDAAKTAGMNLMDGTKDGLIDFMPRRETRYHA